MIIYRTDEPFKLKKSKVVEVICKIAAGVLCGLSLFFLSGTIHEIGQMIKYEKFNVSEYYNGFYIFKPATNFWYEKEKYSTGSFFDFPDEKFYSELVNRWKSQSNLQVMRYNAYIFYESEQYIVLTYFVPETYELDWEGIRLNLKEGKWFQDDEMGVILVKGNGYQLGDEIEIQDEEGNVYHVPVTGISKDNYVVETDNFDGIILNDVLYQRDTVFLLNPFCSLNPRSDIKHRGMDYGCFKTDNIMIWNEMDEYAELIPVKIVDGHHREIERPELITKYDDTLTVMKMMDYIDVFHLWYIPVFIVMFAGMTAYIYFLNQWNFGKRLWIYLLLGVIISNGSTAYRYYSVAVGKFGVFLLFFLVVLIYDIIVKKNTVHGRSYIVDGWDETDVDI